MIRLEGNWTLSNKKHNLSLTANLPGDTHSALLQAEVLKDPYFGMQELDAQWVARENWSYEREFDVPQELLNKNSIYLNIEYLDTVASIFINNKQVAKTNNAFIRYRFEIKKLLKTGKNSIRLVFKSAEIAAKKEAAKQSYPIPHNQFPVQSPHRNLIRKTQCHSGWDWGPCLMVSGVYGEIYIEGITTARIEHIFVKQKHTKNQVTVELSCEIESAVNGKTNYKIQLENEELSGNIVLKKGKNLLSETFTIKNPQLWWPNGYGEANLYELNVSVGDSTLSKRIGLRTLEAIHQEDAHGLGLEFIINNVPIFAKGANWVPADALPQRITKEVLDDLLSSAVEANMNMIRIWGGGRYETEEFYDLCDEKGIMIWQDFMFSCSLYPATEEFLSNVRQEAEYQVKRLQHRSCLALWCGNNENVGALSWYEESIRDRDRYIVDYDRLNEGVIGNTVRSLDPTRTFWSSSPCGGPNDYSDCWHNDSRGDMHFWNVWFERKPFEDYLKIKPRFCSEFGYQSFPSLESIKTYAAEDQLNLTSPVLEFHQRCPGGNTNIIENFARYFRFPSGLENFIYLSQLQQGLAIKTAVEHFRRLRPICMGSLYWQLNEVWPVCSWGSLNYGGKWKLLHYMARNFYAPLLVSVTEKENKTLEIWGCSDLRKGGSGTLSIKVVEFSGKTVKQDKFKVSVPALTSRCLKKLKTDSLITDAASGFLVVELKIDGQTSRNTHFFAPYKQCTLEMAKIKTNIKAEKDGTFAVTLTTDLPAFNVTLNAEEIRGEFDDNVITLLPGKSRTLIFTPKTKTGIKNLTSKLTIKHLRETYA